MKIKKKYAIRKLAVGVASVSIGLFVANSTDNQFGNNFSILKHNSGVVHAACNSNGDDYFLNHYDEYETVYEADGALAKGEHKVARETREGRQLFLIQKNGCSIDEPFTALGDDELYHKPYEVIANKTNIAKEYYLKYLENLKKGVAETEEDKKEEARLWDKYINSPGELFFETRTRKKVLLNKDKNITEPIYNEDGTVTIPSHSVSKKYKNYQDLFHEYSLIEIDENYLNAEDSYNDKDRERDKYNKYVKDSFKLVKVGNVERVPVSTTTIETDYVANKTLDYGVRNTTKQGKEGLRENVVTYEVDRNTGELKNPTTVENNIPMEKKIVEVGTKEKVVYSKKGNDVIKTTTTYALNTTTGEVTPHDNEEVIKSGEVKDKIEYLKVGNDVVKRTTTYKVNQETGEITSEVKDEVIKTGEAKDKVEYLKVGNDVVKRTTTYKVNQETGEITPEVKDEIIKVGEVKDKVEVEKTPAPVRYEKDASREKGQENITVQGKDGTKTTTTTYTVNPKTGEIEAHPQEPVIVEPTNTIVKVAAKDKIEYSIGNYIEKEGYLDNDSVYKKTTVYEVNPENGEITENTRSEIYKKDGVKTKIVKEERITSPVKYEKDSTREKGQENITIQGKDGSKITKIIYSLDKNTGEIIPSIPRTEVVEPTTTTIKVAAKDKVEIVNKKDGSVVKEITTYTVNEKTGEITETKTEEVIKTKTETSKGDELPPVVENKDFLGGVNPDNAPIVENLPELKVAVIKDKENNVLEVIKEDEKPKEIKGYKNTEKVEIDKDGYKVYIYEKVEDKQDSLVDRNKETNEPIKKEKAIREENKDNNKETISKKEELPKTSASMLSTVGLFSIFGLRKNKKKDK